MDRRFFVQVSRHEQLLLKHDRLTQKLLQAFVAAGCTKRYLKDAFRARSPLKSADIRWVSPFNRTRQPDSGSDDVTSKNSGSTTGHC